MTKTPNSYQEQAIKHSTVPELKAERDALLWECQQMLLQISRRSISLKLLGLAKAHLAMLVKYKTDRSRVGRDSLN